ncbi:MAG: hypothetical protein IBX55_09395 [Methyloprofundus sp.]|nr:hypothetical protein [Methyloprofundus sp.]
MRWLVFLLLGFCSLAFAEHEQERALDNQVYSKNSALTVDNLNKAAEFLRDPTAMSGNFRQALRGLSENDAPAPSSGTVTAKTPDLGLPDIAMVGKVFSENKPATVVFKVNGKYHHFQEGDQITQVIDHQLVTFHVQEIKKQGVRLLVMPFNKILIFN